MARYSGIIGVLSIVGLLVYGAIFWLAKPQTLPIERIELLTKLEQQDPKQLQLVASQAIVGGFFSLDLEHFRQQIEALEWVESVSIRKKWPDTVQLSIFERRAVARWSTVDEDKTLADLNGTIEKEKLGARDNLWGRRQLISDKGVIFQPPMNDGQIKKYSNFQLYMGPTGLSKKVLKKCIDMAKKLERANLNVDICGLDRRRAWNIHLVDGFRLRLGRELINGVTKQRIDDFINVYRKTLNEYLVRIAHVDMRYTNGFTVGWKVNTKPETTQD